MVAKVDFGVEGLIETRRDIEKKAEELSGPKISKGIKRAAIMVEGEAKSNLVAYESPSVGGVNTGTLRGKITHEVAIDGDVVQGIVGTNVSYAPYVEFGSRPHWPPLDALRLWAKRKGANVYLVARGIARRGNVKKEFLKKAFSAKADEIAKIIGSAVEGVIKE